MLGKYAIKAERYGVGFNGVFFRKEMPQQDDLIERAKEIYLPIDAQWLDHKKTFVFASGGRLRFRPLENISDAEKYQGQNLSDGAVEEAGNYADPQPIDRLFACLRSSRGVPTQLILTGNPGGPGHQWIKSRYIDPAPKGMKVLTRPLPNGAEHRYVYIPSRLQNNQILLRADPGYINNLYLVGSAELVRAWLEGDWDVVMGAYFDCWRPDLHVLDPFEIPADWLRFRSMDWGSARPFAIHWWAVVQEDWQVQGRILPKGAIICYREWYGCQKQPNGQIEPNTGLKMYAEDVGSGIVEREIEKIAYGVGDPSMWKQDGGPSIAEKVMASMPGRQGFRPADNTRLAGWEQVRGRLIGEDGRPMIYWFHTCADTIRTLPALQHDDVRPEDVDTDGEDHAADSVRYACMSRPWVPIRKTVEPMKGLREMTLNDIWKHAPRQSRRV